MPLSKLGLILFVALGAAAATVLAAMLLAEVAGLPRSAWLVALPLVLVVTLVLRAVGRRNGP